MERSRRTNVPFKMWIWARQSLEYIETIVVEILDQCRDLMVLALLYRPAESWEMRRQERLKRVACTTDVQDVLDTELFGDLQDELWW